MNIHAFIIASFLLFPSACAFGKGEPAKTKGGQHSVVLSGAETEVYKSVGDVNLKIYLFNPTGHQSSDQRSAIVFFFGGGWKAGSPKQFHEHCRHLAERGMVAMTADYRVLSRHGTRAVSCVSDAKSVVRWIRENAKRLGIDPDRVVAAGGSAGGHIAACTGTIEGFDEKGEDASISCKPNAMALFNPALMLAPLGDEVPFEKERMDGLPDRVGVALEALSPVHHVAAGQPPTIIFHGKADPTVPYWTVERFTQRMKEAGNRCDLIGFDEAVHGFFNHGRNDNVGYDKTISELEDFLLSLGFID